MSIDINYLNNDAISADLTMSPEQKKEAQLIRVALNNGFMPIISKGVGGDFIMLSNGSKSIFVKRTPMSNEKFVVGMLKEAMSVGFDGQEFNARLQNAASDGITMSLCNAVCDQSLENFKTKTLSQMNNFVGVVSQNVQAFAKYAEHIGLDPFETKRIVQQMQEDIKAKEKACFDKEVAGIIAK